MRRAKSSNHGEARVRPTLSPISSRCIANKLQTFVDVFFDLSFIAIMVALFLANYRARCLPRDELQSVLLHLGTLLFTVLYSAVLASTLCELFLCGVYFARFTHSAQVLVWNHTSERSINTFRGVSNIISTWTGISFTRVIYRRHHVSHMRKDRLRRFMRQGIFTIYVRGICHDSIAISKSLS